MSGWKKGDLALCVNDKSAPDDPLASSYLKSGRIYLVAVVGRREDGKLAITSREWAEPGHPGRGYAFRTHRFRKLRPASADFTASIRACKPAKQGEPA